MTTVAEIIEEYRKNHIIITFDRDNETIRTDIQTLNIMEAIYILEKVKIRLMFEQDLEKNKIEMVNLIKSLAEDVGKIIGEMQNKTEKLENRMSTLEQIVIPRSEDFFERKKRKKEKK